MQSQCHSKWFDLFLLSRTRVCFTLVKDVVQSAMTWRVGATACRLDRRRRRVFMSISRSVLSVRTLLFCMQLVAAAAKRKTFKPLSVEPCFLFVFAQANMSRFFTRTQCSTYLLSSYETFMLRHKMRLTLTQEKVVQITFIILLWTMNYLFLSKFVGISAFFTLCDLL